MKKIEIETNMLNRNINQFSSNVSSIKKTIDKTYNDIKTLDSTWEGQAKSAFDRQFQLDYNRMIEICNEITQYIERMKSAKEQYENSEARVGEIVASIRI